MEGLCTYRYDVRLLSGIHAKVLDFISQLRFLAPGAFNRVSKKKKKGTVPCKWYGEVANNLYNIPGTIKSFLSG